MSDTFQRVQEVFRTISADPIKESTTIRSLRLDPLDLAEFIFGLEEEFKVEIPDDQAENFQNISEVVARLGRLEIAKSMSKN